MKKENQDELFDMLSKNHVKILDNEEMIITKEEEKISLYGMWCDSNYYERDDEKKEFTLKAMNSFVKIHPNGSRFNILLAHNPNFFETYAKWGADLVLCGHIHGGMVRLPFIGGVFSPDTLFFPKYSKGTYNIENHKMVVSRGLGRGMRGFRFFNRPELGVIILEKETDEME
jgi:predicted MPP superfamily phosphohydrolase